MIAAPTTQSWRSRPKKRRRPADFIAALVVFIIVILVAAPQAQQPQAFNPTTPTTTAVSPVRDAVSGSEIDLMVGRSTVLNVGSTISRVSLTVEKIADAMVTGPSQLLIHGKEPGTISLFVWDREGSIKTFEVKVRRDLSALVAHLKQLFPGEDITTLGSGKDVVLSGTVSSKYVIEKAADVAAGYVEKKDNVVNMLKQQEGVASNQVMLRVRFAEVSRSAMQELGATFFANGYKSEWIGRTAPPGVPAPEFEDGKLVFSDFLNLFVFNAKEGLGGAIRALTNKGLFQSLAEPNLIATNGKEASFLAGGEYPYPVVQSGASTNSITIQFKEFGIRLNFTPTVLGGDLINLKVRPEVSALDFTNAVVLDGFRVPALSTRRTETEVELRDGQTFAIAGLMNNTLTNTMGKIPGIGDIPILGLLFRSKAYQKNQTELVVMITPTIIKRGQMGVSEGLPSLVEPYMNRPNKTYPNPDAYTGSPRYGADQPKPREGNGPAQQPARSGNDNNAPAAAPATTSTAPIPSRPISQTPSNAAPTQSRPAPQSSTPAVTPQAQPKTAPARPSTQPQTQGSSTPPKQSSAAPASKPTATPQAASDKEAAAVKSEALAVERAVERAREQERRAAEGDGRQRADDEKVARARAEEDRRQAEKLAKDRAKREAEIAKKNQELAKKQADEDAKREKALAEAAARLKQAQAAYQAEIEKTKGGSNDKPGSAPKP
ncbi:MAG TPA: pilus assembly protein N-terminal domain-containing protein [Vicinamibacterales bacterium]|nr:pilus assembly protein N-terminal domain-containing protein [Vicinamibacterales bacterium]